MAYYIDFEHWQIKIVCDCPLVIEGLKSNFDFRFGVNRHPDKILMTCSIICDDPDYYRRLEQIDFNGPRVDVSQTVTLQYAFDNTLTWLKVTDTAIIAFDSTNPTVCRVWLAPLDVSKDQKSEPWNSLSRGIFLSALGRMAAEFRCLPRALRRSFHQWSGCHNFRPFR